VALWHGYFSFTAFLSGSLLLLPLWASPLRPHFSAAWWTWVQTSTTRLI
jgi:hypothetical protein